MQKTISQFRVYRPNQRHELGFFSTWMVMGKNIFQARELIWQLFKRDFFAVYKKSFLGITWIFLAPIAGIISWIFLQKTGMLNPGELGIPYPAYVLIGTSMWQLFIGFFKAGELTLSAGQTFVMQVQYPHEALLFKETAQHIANFIIAFALNIVVLMAYGVNLKWQIVFLPLVAVPLFFLGSAIGLIASMLSIVAVDITKVVNMVMSLAMWTTPIIYSDRVSSPFVQSVIKWNPLTYLICSARDIVVYGRLYNDNGYIVCAILSVILFLISWRLFYVSEDRIIERMI